MKDKSVFMEPQKQWSEFTNCLVYVSSACMTGHCTHVREVQQGFKPQCARACGSLPLCLCVCVFVCLLLD